MASNESVAGAPAQFVGAGVARRAAHHAQNVLERQAVEAAAAGELPTDDGTKLVDPATIEVAASLANYVVPVARAREQTEKKGHRRKRQREKAEARQRAYQVGEEHHAMPDADGQGRWSS